MDDNHIKKIEHKVFRVYIWQIIVKFILALIVAYYIGYLLREEAQLSNVASHIVAVLAFLMAMYDTVFEAMRYSIEKEFWKIKD